MSTMYIACNNSMPRGYYLGDVLTVIKAAWMFVENEPHDHILLSLHDREPLNFLWNKFIADNLVTVIHDRWDKWDRSAHYAAFGERFTRRCVKNIPFDTYKELYPRLDGGERQHFLCGREKGLGRENIFFYYYFGQQSCKEEPRDGKTFGPGVIDIPDACRTKCRSVLIAPHEKCHGNARFTHSFWEQVIVGLMNADVHVTINDDRGFMRHAEGPLLARTHFPFQQLAEQVAAQRLVLAGNNGVGWLAGALGTPLLAMERNALLAEYEFARCGLTSLVDVIDGPDPARVVARALQHLEHVP